MIIELGGGKGGLKEYLEQGQKQGRDMHRDQLDQRVPLLGDLEVFELATGLHQGTGRTYDHITLSFQENHVSDEMLRVAVQEFKDFALSAWTEEEREAVPFYAEIHRPKILSYTNKETGEEVERKTHVHIAFGRHDITTGKAINPLGFTGQSSEAGAFRHIDAFQEQFNARHGFSSPKDNPKITPENAADIIARYSGSKPNELGTFNQKKASLELTLQKEIIAQDITTWAAFGKLLERHGKASIMRAGQDNETFRIKPHGTDRPMRLKGVFFTRQFIERPTADKVEILQVKAREAYLEQMQPRKEPSYLAATLEEWHTIKARENRFLHTGSPLYKNVYLPADTATRLQILDDLERKHHAISSPKPNQNRQITPARNGVRILPVRNLDGILKRSARLLRGDPSLHVPGRLQEGSDSLGLRQADGGSADTSGDPSFARSPASSNAGTGQPSVSSTSEARQLDDRLKNCQPSSVVDHLVAEQRDDYDHAQVKDRYKQIAKNLDCALLLAHLSHSNGINPTLYPLTQSKTGEPRIKCGSRALSPSDFLMKELGLQWKEAAPILREVYENQIGKKTVKERGKPTGSVLWQDFKADYSNKKTAHSAKLKEFDNWARARKAGLKDYARDEQKKRLEGLRGQERKTALALQKLQAAQTRLNIILELNEKRLKLVQELPNQQDAFKIYLQRQAEQGDAAALLELRKLDGTARDVDRPAIKGTLVLSDEMDASRSLSKFMAELDHSVSWINGDVTYKKNGNSILRDEGRNLAVLDQSEESIATALLIAKEKFGLSLTLTGPPDFQMRVAQVAAERGIFVNFTDPALEAARQKAVEAQRAPVRPALAVASSNQPTATAVEQAQRADVQPVAQPALALTAEQWVATQSKPIAPARRADSKSVSYTVLHVAPNGVVIDHGRTVAIYPLPTGLALQAGQKVFIVQSGLQLASVHPEIGKGKGRA